MTRKYRHLIRYVCRQTGLTAHQIRAWEKRYQAVVPERTETNRRLYSEADIERLQLLAKAREAGLSLSQVAHLPADELFVCVLITVVKRLKHHRLFRHLYAPIQHIIGIGSFDIERRFEVEIGFDQFVVTFHALRIKIPQGNSCGELVPH